jgi:hypothetical protein
LFGNSDNRLSLELLYSYAQTEALETSMSLPVRYLRYLAGLELKLTDGTRLQLEMGG